MRLRHLATLGGGIAVLFAIATAAPAPAYGDACKTACKKRFRGFWKAVPRLACITTCRFKKSKLGKFIKKASQSINRGARRAWSKVKSVFRKKKAGPSPLLRLHLTRTRPKVEVDDLAALSSAVYSLGDAAILRQWIPKGYKIIDQLVAPKKAPLQAAALEHEPSGKVVIAFRGTEFLNPSDLLADLGIAAKNVASLVRTGLQAVRGMWKSLGKKLAKKLPKTTAFFKRIGSGIKKAAQKAWGWIKQKTRRLRESKFGKFVGKVARGVGKALTSVYRKAKARLDALFAEIAKGLSGHRVLKIKLDAAKAYVRRVLDEVKKHGGARIAAGDLIFTGHSLGGYLAQVLGVLHRAPTHTFNAPGARAEFPNVTADWIVNHAREHDLVGRIGQHLGQLQIYEDVEYLLSLASITQRYLVRNHGIVPFFYGLRQGLRGRVHQMIKDIKRGIRKLRKVLKQPGVS